MDTSKAIEVGSRVTFFVGLVQYAGRVESFGESPSLGTGRMYRTARVRLDEGGLWTVGLVRCFLASEAA